jgi:hypothetical protein
MTSDEKIKWVRDFIYEQEKLNGLGVVSYSLAPVTQEVGGGLDDFAALFGNTNNIRPSEKKTVVAITTEEQIDILKRLEKQQLIKITELNKVSAFLEVVSLHPAPIKLKTMEHIARKLADTFTGSQIVDALIDFGIPRADIPYPNTKWRTLQDLFVFLATSPDPEQREKFGGVITTFLHPLNFNADESVSHKLIEDFNKYLKYDGYEITAADDGDGYQLVSTKEKTKVAPPVKAPVEQRVEQLAKATPAPPKRVPAPIVELEPPYTPAEQEQMYSEQVEYETGILRQPKVAEHLAVVRQAYKGLMAITSSFCDDPTEPSRELNTAYGELSKVVAEDLNGYCGDTSEFEVFSFDEYKKNNFGIPFGSLYSAELDFKKKGRQLHWDEIRPEMNAVLGRIEDLCETANSPEVISDPKIQKVIGDAMLLLSKIAAKRKGADAAQSQPTLKMEIVKVPELQVRNVEDTTIVKGKKRIHLPKFKSTDWGKITIRFIDERNVVITADKKQIPSDYEALGFADDKRDKPNTAWAFLRGLADRGGETLPLPTPIPDTIKQHKRQLSDRLKTIFKNDTDPFYEPTDTRTYRIKINLIPPHNERESLYEPQELLTEE